MKLCKICNETIAIGKCKMCNRDVCRYCSLIPTLFAPNGEFFTLEFKKPSKKELKNGNVELICKDCVRKLRKIWRKESNERKRDLANGFLDILIKLTILERVMS